MEKINKTGLKSQVQNYFSDAFMRKYSAALFLCVTAPWVVAVFI